MPNVSLQTIEQEHEAFLRSVYVIGERHALMSRTIQRECKAVELARDRGQGDTKQLRIIIALREWVEQYA